MSHLLLVSGIWVASSAAAAWVPAMARLFEHGSLDRDDCAVLSLGLVLMLGGLTVVWRELRKPRAAPMPAPVRAAVTGNILFLAFCALEFSDGLLRAGGRVLYWTSILFLPALMLLYGLILAQRWAWWLARAVTAVFALWFLAFIVVIPFADVRGPGGPTPWWGRMYMAGVSLVFASVSIFAFRSLGQAEARNYFRPAHQA